MITKEKIYDEFRALGMTIAVESGSWHQNDAGDYELTAPMYQLTQSNTGQMQYNEIPGESATLPSGSFMVIHRIKYSIADQPSCGSCAVKSFAQ